jgi:heme A synthase
MQTVADPNTARDAGQAVHNALVSLSLRVAGARADRLALGADRTNDLKWLTVLFLCLMTQIAIGLVHLDRPRANALALTFFSVAAVVALGLIAQQESPFDGALQISKAPLDNVLRLAPHPGNPND